MAKSVWQRITDERNEQYAPVPGGHTWVRDTYDGSVEIFAYTAGPYCNGPECSACGAGFCHHCDPERITEACPRATVTA